MTQGERPSNLILAANIILVLGLAAPVPTRADPPATAAETAAEAASTATETALGKSQEAFGANGAFKNAKAAAQTVFEVAETESSSAEDDKATAETNLSEADPKTAELNKAVEEATARVIAAAEALESATAANTAAEELLQLGERALGAAQTSKDEAAQSVTEIAAAEKFGKDRAVAKAAVSTGAGYLTAGALDVGATTIPLDTGTGTVLAGKFVTFAGHAKKYCVKTRVEAPGDLELQAPGLLADLADNAALTVGKEDCGPETPAELGLTTDEANQAAKASDAAKTTMLAAHAASNAAVEAERQAIKTRNLLAEAIENGTAEVKEAAATEETGATAIAEAAVTKAAVARKTAYDAWQLAKGVERTAKAAREEAVRSVERARGPGTVAVRRGAVGGPGQVLAESCQKRWENCDDQVQRSLDSMWEIHQARQDACNSDDLKFRQICNDPENPRPRRCRYSASQEKRACQAVAAEDQRRQMKQIRRLRKLCTEEYRACVGI